MCVKMGFMRDTGPTTAAAVLRVASQLVEGIQEGAGPAGVRRRSAGARLRVRPDQRDTGDDRGSGRTPRGHEAGGGSAGRLPRRSRLPPTRGRPSRRSRQVARAHRTGRSVHSRRRPGGDGRRTAVEQPAPASAVRTDAGRTAPDRRSRTATPCLVSVPQEERSAGDRRSGAGQRRSPQHPSLSTQLPDHLSGGRLTPGIATPKDHEHGWSARREAAR